MIISHEYKFIFIHIPKVAGRSIDISLGKYGAVDNYSVINKIIYKLRLTDLIIHRLIPQNKKWSFMMFRKHETALNLKKILPAKIWKNYFKFSFVRNPFDWEVSHYHYIRQKKNHPFHEIVKLESFEDYLKSGPRLAEIEQPNEGKILSEFITDSNNNMLVDYVGKFENLENDFLKIMEKIGLKIELPWTNKSNHSLFKDYYTAESIKIVQELHLKDFQLFGYDQNLC